MQIYLARNNQQAGPYTVEQLNQMLASQQVVLTDLIWHEGMTDWKPLGEVTQGQWHYYPAGYQAQPTATPNPFQTTAEKAANPSHPQSTELASIGKRFAAKIIDLALWIPSILFVSAFVPPENVGKIQQINQQLLSGATTEQAIQLQQQVFDLIPNISWAGMAIYILLMLALQAFLLHKSGQSVGKKVMQLHIVDAESHQPVAVHRSFFLRSLLVVVLVVGIHPLLIIIDALFLFSKKRQALHDKIARTIVIDRSNR